MVNVAAVICKCMLLLFFVVKVDSLLFNRWYFFLFVINNGYKKEF